jgi:predicted Fe-S protein YdhL (DUF1289 family)
VAICRLSRDTGYCLGCFRNLEEIAGWLAMPRERRLEVLARLPEREAAEVAARHARRAARAQRKAD